MKTKNKTLIFVYNADSGLWNGALDVMHKVFSPKTYSCNLCGITYGALSVKKEWAEFIEKLPLETDFLHRDEFQKQFDNKAELPAVFLTENDAIEPFISAQEMNQMDLKELKKAIAGQIKKSNYL